MTITIGSILPVGTIIHSMLSVAQFSSEYGDNWVIADGRGVIGSRYEQITGVSAIPDMRGVFLRGKGAAYNPDGDLALGTYSADKYASHSHNVPFGTSGTTIAIYTSTSANTRSAQVPTDVSGGNETSPKSVTVNIFIRIN
jgi:hypothetical protein